MQHSGGLRITAKPHSSRCNWGTLTLTHKIYKSNKCTHHPPRTYIRTFGTLFCYLYNLIMINSGRCLNYMFCSLMNMVAEVFRNVTFCSFKKSLQHYTIKHCIKRCNEQRDPVYGTAPWSVQKFIFLVQFRIFQKLISIVQILVT